MTIGLTDREYLTTIQYSPYPHKYWKRTFSFMEVYAAHQGEVIGVGKTRMEAIGNVLSQITK